MTLGVFENCTFCVKVKHLPCQQKKKLQTDIKESGGNVSFLLNPQCTHVILDSADVLSQYQLNSNQKHHIHTVNLDFIWEPIKERRLLDVKNYSPNKSLDSTLPPCQEASSSHLKTGKLCLNNATETESIVKLTEFYTKNVEIPHFPQDFKVAKYDILEKVGPKGGQEIAVVELQCSPDLGDPTFLLAAHFLLAGGTEPRNQFSVKHTSADASEYYENYIEELKKQGFLLRESFTPEATQLASEKLQALLLEKVIHSSTVSQEVSNLVEMIWTEALSHLEHMLLESTSRISLNYVSKAEGILLLVKEALKNGETEEQLQKIMSEFYRLIPHRGTTTEKVNLRLLAKKEDLCQLIRDISLIVCETNLSKPNPPSLAKYRVLRCKIEHVGQNTEEFLRLREEVLQNNHSKRPLDILQIFSIGRLNESTEFLSQLGTVKPLLHGSPVWGFVGILSQGLLLPKVVEHHGIKRTDIGNLGSGIYFSDSFNTSIKCPLPGETDGMRFLVVCGAALGKCMDLHKKDFSVMEAPPGYDSVHGVPKTAIVSTDFEDDEFVVYRTSQVKMKYIIKFCIPGDEVKDFHPCNNTELDKHTPEISNFSKVEDYQLPDTKPLSSIKADLQDTCGNSVPLEDLNIKGKIIGFVAQDTVEKICIKEIGTKQSFSLSIFIEMPYVIEFISSDTHELKKRNTDCKAVISTMNRSSLDSSGFSLHIGLSDAYLPRMWVEKHPEKESEVEKSDITRRDFPASFLVLNDKDDTGCEESWKNFVAASELFSLQTEDGFWKLTPALRFILNLNTTILNSFLEKKAFDL